MSLHPLVQLGQLALALGLGAALGLLFDVLRVPRTTSSTPVTVRWLRSSSVTACGRRCGAAFLSSYGIGSPPGSGLLPAYAGRAGDMRGDGRQRRHRQ